MNIKIEPSLHPVICKQRNKGATVRQLAEHYKVSVGTIHGILKKHNLTKPKPERSFSFDAAIE